MTSRLGDDVDPRARETVQVDVAAALFYAGQHQQALRLAGEIAGRSGASLSLAHWISGLAAWRLNQIDRAGRHFEAMSRAQGVSAWDVSGAAFWAARAHMRAGRGHQVAPWLERAAAYPRTFYGLIARRLLGLDIAFRWDVPSLNATHLRALAATPGGERAIGLLQAGQRELAEAELRRIHPQGQTLLEEALLTIAVQAKLPALAMRVGNALAATEGSTWDAALYPVPPWDPSEGFAVDRALVYALMRQESRFDPRARSPAGASGLMQLMPATAGAMAGAPIRSGQMDQLLDPTFNVTLGQRYIVHLMQQPEIGANLLMVLASYNAGPTAVARWRKAMQAEHDPLMFIESLPARETRGFLERVLANFWIYRLRLGRDVPTLDAIAAGQWPLYLPETGDTVEVADTDGAH
jgi:soluble lytic murein transglycosylase-like protein